MEDQESQGRFTSFVFHDIDRIIFMADLRIFDFSDTNNNSEQCNSSS